MSSVLTRHRRAAAGQSRPALWAGGILLIAGVDRGLDAAPAALRMLGLIVTLFLVMKAIVLMEDGRGLPTRRLAAFVFGWVGMRPEVFAARSTKRLAGAGQLMGAGIGGMLGGLAVIYAAAAAPLPRALAVIGLFAGCSLTLHFGILNVVSGVWRLAGFDCRAPFRAPWRAVSLAEFWGRRWNTAFSEMISIAVVRPITGALGSRWARFCGFVASGLLHEVAITLPTHSGYGLPTLYFAIQGILVDVEQRRGGRRWLTWAGVLLPLPLLFTPAFVDQIVWPIRTLFRG